MTQREFKVGVFQRQGKRKILLSAYTTWFNPGWGDCCVHTVYADSGVTAKKLAMQEHRDRCIDALEAER